jgi:hypothetical protein
MFTCLTGPLCEITKCRVQRITWLFFAKWVVYLFFSWNAQSSAAKKIKLLLILFYWLGPKLGISRGVVGTPSEWW